MILKSKQLHAIFRGRVQGVGFRWTVVDVALRHHLTGTAKNLADGTVEVFAQGPQDSLYSFLQDIQAEPGLARIESVSAEYSVPSADFDDFRIIY